LRSRMPGLLAARAVAGRELLARLLERVDRLAERLDELGRQERRAGRERVERIGYPRRALGQVVLTVGLLALRLLGVEVLLGGTLERHQVLGRPPHRREVDLILLLRHLLGRRRQLLGRLLELLARLLALLLRLL